VGDAKVAWATEGLANDVFDSSPELIVLNFETARRASVNYQGSFVLSVTAKSADEVDPDLTFGPHQAEHGVAVQLRTLAEGTLMLNGVHEDQWPMHVVEQRQGPKRLGQMLPDERSCSASGRAYEFLLREFLNVR